MTQPTEQQILARVLEQGEISVVALSMDDERILMLHILLSTMIEALKDLMPDEPHLLDRIYSGVLEGLENLNQQHPQQLQEVMGRAPNMMAQQLQDLLERGLLEGLKPGASAKTAEEVRRQAIRADIVKRTGGSASDDFLNALYDKADRGEL